jgi:hypothetical protein
VTDIIESLISHRRWAKGVFWRRSAGSGGFVCQISNLEPGCGFPASLRFSFEEMRSATDTIRRLRCHSSGRVGLNRGRRYRHLEEAIKSNFYKGIGSLAHEIIPPSSHRTNPAPVLLGSLPLQSLNYCSNCSYLQDAGEDQ